MTFTQAKTPHQLLVRWDDAGALSGASIAFREAILQDGVEVASKFLDPQPVSMAGATGFPLADVLDLIQVSALADSEAKAAQIETLTAEKAAADQAKDAALAQVASLQEQLAAFLPSTSSNGVPEWVYASQAYKALILAGLMPAVKAGLAAMPGVEGELARADFEKSARFYRTNPTLAALGPALGMTDAQLDQLFIAAASL